MAISPERVVRSTSRLILGLGFRGRRIEWTYFQLHQIQDGGCHHVVVVVAVVVLLLLLCVCSRRQSRRPSLKPHVITRSSSWPRCHVTTVKSGHDTGRLTTTTADGGRHEKNMAVADASPSMNDWLKEVGPVSHVTDTPQHVPLRHKRTFSTRLFLSVTLVLVLYCTVQLCTV